MSRKNTRQSANNKAIVASIKGFAALVVIASVVYSEILFLGIIGSLFPTSGPLAVGAMIGAVTTGMSILALCIAKSHWFRPGMQLVVAWIFTIVEVSVLIANDILAYQLHAGAKLDQFMDAWRTFCVAAPVLSLVGWILLFYFSPERHIVHKRMEMEDNEAIDEITFQTDMHEHVMEIRSRAANKVRARLEEKIETHMDYHLDRAAAKFVARVATDLTGEEVSPSELMGSPRPAPKQLAGSPKIVDADPEPAKAAHTRQQVDPHGVKPQVDAEKKSLDKKTSLLDKFHSGVDKLLSMGNSDSDSEAGTLEPPVNYEEEDYEEVPQETIETPWKPGDSLPDNYLDWNDAQWKQAKDQLDAFKYAELFDKAFPNEEVVEEAPKKKGKGGRKPKNARVNQGE